jgi:hypothetical protein
VKPWVWIVLALGAVGVAGIAAWYFTRARKDAIMARCNALRAEIARIRTQGGDVSRANELEAQLTTCLAEAEAAGFAIDYKEIDVANCAQIQTQIDQEWEHYRSTATEDAIKRNNGRGQILRLGEGLASCYSAVLDSHFPVKAYPDSIEYFRAQAELRAFRRKVDFSLSQAIERRNCFNDRWPLEGNTKPGCSRYGVNEPTHIERANDEQQRVIMPLRLVVSKVQARIAAIADATRKASVAPARAVASSGAAARGFAV